MASQRNSETSRRLQVQVDPYTDHVLNKLVGVKGRRVSDVAYFIFRQWISDHAAELADYGIRVHIPDGTFEPIGLEDAAP